MIRGKDFYGGPMVKNLPASAGDMGLIPGIWKDATCQEATKPVGHNYWAHALQEENPPQWEAHTLLASTREPPGSPLLEKAHGQQRRPSAAKNK